MSPWWFIMSVWLVAQILGQAVEAGTGWTSSHLTWPLLAADTHMAVAGGDWQPGGSRIYIGDEAIDYTAVADDCPGQPMIPGPCLTGLVRGKSGTTPGSYGAGSVLRGSESQLISSLSELRLVETDTAWGVVTWPIQSFRALTRVVGEMGSWDYAYLDGGGQYLVTFLQLFNLAMVIMLVRLFAGPLSNLASGVARGLTGGRFG